MKKIKQFEKYTGPDEDYDDFDDETFYHEDDYIFGRPNYSKMNEPEEFTEEEGYKKLNRDDDGDEEDMDDNDDMSHLLYLLRQMFRNSDIDAEISSDDLDIIIDVYLNKKERLKDVIKVFEVAKKLRRDILPQYDSEFQIYYSKTGQPILTFNFSYGDGQDDDKSPF